MIIRFVRLVIILRSNKSLSNKQTFILNILLTISNILFV